MSRDIFISVDQQERRVAIVNSGHLEEFYIERLQEPASVGNIYKGKVENVVPSINAAFVNVGFEKNGFLYLDEALDAPDLLHAEVKHAKGPEIRVGQEVLVQVVKEPFGTKGPRLSALIGLPGRSLVLMPNSPSSGVSRRIDNEAERDRLKKTLRELKLPKEMGIIVRTAAINKTKIELQRELQYLFKQWVKIKRLSARSSAPFLLYQDFDLILRIIRDSFTDDIGKLVVDSKAEFRRIWGFVRTFMPALRKKVSFVQNNVSLFSSIGIDKQINGIFEKKVSLKSGGYLVIEPTEGLVVIDVNSGRFRGNLNPIDMAFKVNCEAAHEAARQLKLRDLGGIIVIDFIDMEIERHRRQVLEILKKHLAEDRAKTDVLGISKLGLVEMTRERVHRTLETISFQDCPYCKGKGKVKSALTISIEVFNALKQALKGKVWQRLSVTVHPDVAKHMTDNKTVIQSIQHTFHSRITINPDEKMHFEEFRVDSGR